MKQAYTEADYKRMHKSFVEDMIDTLISEWHNPVTDPLRARVCRNLASQMEALREVTPDNLNVWVSAANEENNYKTIHSERETHTNTDK
jgi:hypothetical protein